MSTASPSSAPRCSSPDGPVFPFSADIYRQLAELPPEQHPRLCRRCGWDEWTDQPDREGNDTAWSAEHPEYCTRCEQDLARTGRL